MVTTSTNRLTPLEAATLAAIIPSPRIYDPVKHPSRVARRARQILRWMRVIEKTESSSAPTLPPPFVAESGSAPLETRRGESGPLPEA